VLAAVPPGRFPWPVIAINLVGSLVLGAVMAEQWRPPRRRLLHDAVGIGFCGGLTTMSTFALEVAELLGDGAPVTALLYTVASVAGGLVAVVTGAALLHRARSVTLPSEERP
jgi:CrcB protein